MLDWSKKITVSDKQKDKENSLRAQRDAAISETDWLVMRHRDEVDAGFQTTLTNDEYQSLLLHRQELRDWPKLESWSSTKMPEMTQK